MSADLSAEMGNILEEIAEEFSQAEVFNEWMPPDGDYTVLITGYADGVSVKGNKKYAWWRQDGRLLVPGDPSLDEKDFTLGFYRSTAIGFLKQAMAVIAGRKIDDVRQAQPLLAGAVGWIINIRKSTTSKDGVEYPRVKILNVVQRGEAQDDSGGTEA